MGKESRSLKQIYSVEVQVQYHYISILAHQLKDMQTEFHTGISYDVALIWGTYHIVAICET